MTTRDATTAATSSVVKSAPTLAALLALWYALSGQVDQLRQDMRELRSDVTRLMMDGRADGGTMLPPAVHQEQPTCAANQSLAVDHPIKGGCDPTGMNIPGRIESSRMARDGP